MKNKEVESKLRVGAKVKLGKKYCKNSHLKPGTIIELVEGYFDYDNGLYTETQTAPSVWNEMYNEFDSIYHLFGNDLGEFMDCQILEEK